jgi:hypothetical protein
LGCADMSPFSDWQTCLLVKIHHLIDAWKPAS